MKIETLEHALSLVPEYFPLVPGVDKWKEGDEYFSRYGNDWTKAEHMSTKILCEMGTLISYKLVRRPIPQEIRLQEARWILYDSLANGLYGDPSYGFSFKILKDIEDKRFDALTIESGNHSPPIRAFNTKGNALDFVILIGGESAVIEMLTQGRGALWKWVQENRV